MNQSNQATSPSVRSPHHAWLAPLFGIGAAMLVVGATSHLRETTDSVVVAMLPGLAFIAFLVFGLIKSLQCLSGARRIGHGIAGLLLNGAAILFVCMMFYSAVFAVQNRNSPEALVKRTAIQLENDAPVEVDETTTLVRVFVDPATTLNLEFEIHGIPPEAMSPEAFDRIETMTRENVQDGPFGKLLSNGANVHYIYVHEDRSVRHEFTIKGTAGK